MSEHHHHHHHMDGESKLQVIKYQDSFQLIHQIPYQIPYSQYRTNIKVFLPSREKRS